MKKLQIQTEAVTNGVNEQDTSATEQRKPTKRLTKIRRVVKWSAAAGIVIYLEHFNNDFYHIVSTAQSV